MKRKFQESAADYYYQRLERMENRIRSLNSCILDREEERDISIKKAEELTDLIEKADEYLDQLNDELKSLEMRLKRSNI